MQTAKIRRDDLQILEQMQKRSILMNCFKYEELEWGADTRVTVTWLGRMSVEEIKALGRYTKNSRGLKALFSSLQEKMRFDVVPLTEQELIKHNLLYVAISRIRERAIIFAK
jgi:hypothetical protein